MAFAHRIEIQRHIQIGCGKQGVGRAAGKHRFKGTAFKQAAAIIENQRLQRSAHRQLIEAGV